LTFHLNQEPGLDMETTRISLKRVVWTGVRVLLILAAIAPLGYTVYQEWPQLRTVLEGISWGDFVLAQLILLVVMALIGFIPWASLRHLGSPFQYFKATAIYFFTQVFKYLPGGVWAFPGRVAVYQVLGVGSAQSVVSVFRETTAMFLGAALVGVMGLFQGLSLSDELRLVLGLGTLASVVVILIIQMPWTWKIFSSFKLFSKSPLSLYTEVNPEQRDLRWLPWTLAGSIGFWLLFGLPFRQLAIALYPSIADLSWLEASSIFALAWCAGFVVVFVPAGFGVRESALALLLANIMPVEVALSLALLARVAWIVAEGFWILITMVWVGRSPELSWEVVRNFRE
jgi:uncharacterized membrane protein YbhN (UPF0104 family)